MLLMHTELFVRRMMKLFIIVIRTRANRFKNNDFDISDKESNALLHILVALESFSKHCNETLF